MHIVIWISELMLTKRRYSIDYFYDFMVMSFEIE